MKTNWLFLLILFAVVQASAQAIELQSGVDPHEVELYRATVRTMAGEKIDGIFYAMTDSSFVFFASDRVTIKQFRAGQLPNLYTMNMTDVKQISLRRPGRFLRFAGIGIGIGGTLFGTALWMVSTPTTIGNTIFGVLIGFTALGGTVGLVVQGIFPEHTERIPGRPARFSTARDHLDQYTVVRQF